MKDRSLKRVTRDYIRGAMIPQKEKMSFSKIMFLLIFAMTLFVVLFSCIMVIVSGETEPLIYLIPAVFTECAVVSGFYSYKAKSENKIKLDIQRRLIDSLLDEEDVPPSQEEDDREEEAYENDEEEQEEDSE